MSKAGAPCCSVDVHANCERLREDDETSDGLRADSGVGGRIGLGVGLLVDNSEGGEASSLLREGP